MRNKIDLLQGDKSEIFSQIFFQIILKEISMIPYNFNSGIQANINMSCVVYITDQQNSHCYKKIAIL